MNCNYHSLQEAHAICEKCKSPICVECASTIDDKTVCHHCIQQHLFSSTHPVEKKSFWQNFLFFCFSLIPGVAHMHMGLFRRGMQLLLITFGVISLSSYINLDFIIPMVLVPTWFFSFFESYKFKRQTEKGLELNDQDLFDRQIFDYTPLLKNRRLIGSTILVIGILGLMRMIERSYKLVSMFGDYYYVIKDSIIPLCLILGGIYLIIKATQKKPISIQDSSEKQI
ncbi:MAG: B-box zinc finger protein [Desulfitobacteriaceae bacterium]